MDLMDFFDLSKEFKPVLVEGSQTQVQLKQLRQSLVFEESKKPHKGKEYATEYQKIEEEEIKGAARAVPGNTGENYLSQLEELTSVFSTANVDDLMQEELTQVYDKYDFDQKSKNVLPILEHKKKIVSVIETNQVTIIQGSTGCGKTTQVPQFILDSCREKNKPCRIIVTQPRRIAAITVARRVCKERNWELGTVVGFQVGLKAETSSDTLILYCTTGILLQKLIATKHMSNFTHVILDEVHERDEDTDFALLVVRRLLRTTSPHVKVVLMSATINVARFSNYFSFPMNNKWEPAPVIDLDKYRTGRRNYRISTYFLCELKQIGPLPEVRKDEPCITDEGYNVATRLIKEFDRLEEQEKKTSKGAVLVFLPGILEIEKLYLLLDSFSKNYKWWVKPLHSTITTDEQEMVFQRPPPGYRKIILSTNIAESSITVSDIVYVIDFCLTKELYCDTDTNYSSLQLTWAAKTNCIQRAGRSGRVADGRVYRLVPREFYDKCLAQEGVPEMLRCPLSKTVLHAKLLNMGEPKALLALAMDPPDLSNIESTILLLKEAGALLPTVGGQHSEHDGDITFMGRVMAKLPVDIYIGKLILLGHVFSVLSDCIIMGAAMSVRNMFSTPFRERMAAYHSKLTWADSSCSDCIAFLNAYKVWHHHKMSGFFKRSAGGGDLSWAKRYFIQLSAMQEVDILVTDLKERLKQMDIEETVGPERVRWTETEHSLVLKIVMAGAFYPNYFVRSAQGGQVDEREAVKELAGHNPYNSVFLQGMPMNQPGILYVKSIKEALKPCAKDMKVTFDGSTKVYVEFGQTFSERDDRNLDATIPGKVSMAVYRAVKLRQLKIPIILNMMLPHLAAERIKQLGLSSKGAMLSLEMRGLEQKNEQLLPSVSTSSMEIAITHVIDPGHFWGRKADELSTHREVVLLTELNNQMLPCLTERPKIGVVYVAPYSDKPNAPKLYYRARVNAINPRKGKEHLIQVFFIDYGNTEFVTLSDLRNFSEKNIADGLHTIMPLACEFVLSEIKPSLLKNPRGVWSEEAHEEFRNLTEGKIFTAEIYSVVHGVISVELFKQFNGQKTMSSVNKNLIEVGYAEPAEESFLSKANHELRLQHREWTKEQKQAYDRQQETNLPWVEEIDPDPPKPEECRIRVELKGPRSPLEMKLYNLTRSGQRRDVAVEWNSVNSVLLDTDPQDPHERMLVAATVSLNQAGDRMNLRHTTLLPNIHGLPALICLIFAPEIELRTNESVTQYTGALCGLGCNPETNKPIFPDHDLEVTFDTEITINDIQSINRLRYWMSMALYTEEYQETLEAGALNIIRYQQKVKEILFELLKVKRKDIPLVVPVSQFMWKLAPKHLLLSPGDAPGVDRIIFRLHWAIELQKEDENRRRMKNHIEQLHYLAKGSHMIKFITCELCNVNVNGTSALRIHLETELHKGKEMTFIHNSKPLLH